MIQRLVHFFLDRHLLTNGVFLLIFIAGIFGYQTIKKEEFPDITFRTMAIQTVYPNATAEDVESDVTIPIEERIQNISGIQKINSSSALGLSSITVELDRNADVQTVKTDLSNAIQSVPLPDDVLNDPTIRHFDISRKAILDIGLYIKDTPNLSRPERFELQRISRQLNAFLTSNRAFSET
ncbi:MAG: efflux RND transporter permease subunit, partial [Candidatus Margulisiibacteriota bacterium]